MTKRVLNSVFIATLLLVILSACGGSTMQPVPEGEERDAILAYAEPAADVLFEGMNANDYALFSQDFNSTMQTSIDEKSFVEMQEMYDAKIGDYVSREVSKIEKDAQYVAVTYEASFELDDPVLVRLVFENNETHNLAGLWFDSAKLREK